MALVVTFPTFASDIDPEGRRERVAIVEMMAGQRHDRQIERHGIYPAWRHALRGAAREHSTDLLDQRRGELRNEFGGPDEAALENVLSKGEGHELRVGREMVDRKVDQPVDRLSGLEMVELQGALVAPYIRVYRFERGDVESLFAAEIVVCHAHIDARFGDD